MSYHYDDEYDDDFIEESKSYHRKYNFREETVTKKYNDCTQEFFKKRRPKVKLYREIPVKMNEAMRLAIDMDHQIMEMKATLKDQESEDQLILGGLDQQLLGSIDLNVTEQPNSQLRIVMKRNKLVKIIDLQQAQKREQLDIGKQKIKQNPSAPDDILNPTKDQLHHALQSIKSKFRHIDAFHILSKLYKEVIIRKRPLNDFLHLFWDKAKDDQLLRAFIKANSIQRAGHSFSLQYKIKVEVAVRRLRYLLRRAMARYNLQVEIFRKSLTNLTKISQVIVSVILQRQEKNAQQVRVLLCKLALSLTVDRDSFLHLATKMHHFFESILPVKLQK